MNNTSQITKSPRIHAFTFNSNHCFPTRPPLPFFGPCQLRKRELKWWVSLSPLTPFPFSVLRHSQLLLFLLLLLTGECLMSLSPVPFLYIWYQHLFHEAKEEKALKNIRIHIKWASSGVSWGASDWEPAAGQAWFAPSFVLGIFFIPQEARGLRLPQSTWTISDPNGILVWLTT